MLSAPSRSILTRRAVPALLLAAAVLTAGCIGYSAWPPEEGSKVPSNPNFNEMRLAMTRALEWTVDRYPPGPINRPDLDSPVAINLPEGVRSSMYRIIVENVSHRAQPLRPDNTHLPIYHITAVSVTGDDATVNIARPVSGWGTDNPVYQGVTLELRGGMFREWRVVRHQLWTVGAIEPRPYYFIPDSVPEQPDESEPEQPAADEATPESSATEPTKEAPAEPISAEQPGTAEASENEPAPSKPNAGAPTWD